MPKKIAALKYFQFHISGHCGDNETDNVEDGFFFILSFVDEAGLRADFNVARFIFPYAYDVVCSARFCMMFCLKI